MTEVHAAAEEEGVVLMVDMILLRLVRRGIAAVNNLWPRFQSAFGLSHQQA